MTKEVFLLQLRKRLHGLSKEAIDSRIEFYSEMIDEAMEDGLSEEEAINKIGTVDEVINKILEDTPILNIVKDKKSKPKKKRHVGEIILLILGFPLWFPLILTAFILMLVAYILIWVLVLVVYVVFIALAAASIGGIVVAISLVSQGNAFYAGLYVAGSLVCAGLAILGYFAAIYASKGAIKLTKKIGVKIKLLLLRRGEENEDN